ncbi:peroxidase-like [Planococcus citri]|uniref:peroxidase-like n=1 Tax=Planococcus citri TaxID=170843 RepID=UPI0031F8C3AE
MVKIILWAVLVTAFLLVHDSVFCSTLLNVNVIDIHRSKRSLLSDSKNNFTGFLSTAQQNSADVCLPKISCNASEKYRSYDGSCNNLEKPAWGTPNTPVVRLLPPSYADGKGQMRLSQDGKPLPNPRVVRTTLLPDGDVPDAESTLAVVGWGQMVAHDITMRATLQAPAASCCNEDGSLNPHPACLPIAIPSNDTFYSKFKQLCVDMKRVSTTSNMGCNISVPQQIAAVTHYLDGSFIYGLDKEKSNSLRSFRDGLLKTQTNENNKTFLINVQNSTGVCDLPKPSDVCYLAGDAARVNLNTEIAASQIMFLRLHNKLATDLHRLHANWSDEIIFQEARRIVIAIVQHITYNEYLPVLLGSTYVEKNNLAPQKSGYAKGYNSSINPSSISEFVAAAFRSLHSTIVGNISMMRENRTVSSTVQLADHADRAGIILQTKDNFDYFLRGLISQPQNDQDKFCTAEITNSIFHLKNKDSTKRNGIDLVSIDIHRGREYGVPPYSTMRRVCGLPSVNKFEDLKDVMEADKISQLAQVYSSVHDIDYFVGGLLEKKLPGTLTSPSFHCVIAEAFYRYKFADRFFYEFDGHPGAFTSAQLDSVRKFTYSMLVCLTSDNLQSAQPSGFHKIDSKSNPLKPCSEIIKEFKLDAWA